MDIHVHLLQFQPSRLASKILPHPYIFCFVAISIASRLPPGSSWKIVCFAPNSHGREPELQQRMRMPFSRLAESALFCANFVVAPAGLICLACAILLAVTVWKLTAFSTDFGGRCGIYGVCDTEPTEGERLVRQLWHYTPFTVEKPAKQVQRVACSGSFF